MSVKRNFSIKLEFFVGFYDSYLSDSDTEYYAIKDTANYYNELCGQEIVDMNDLDINYDDYRKDVVDEIIRVYPDFLPSIVESIKFRKMWSPKEYNFATDEIYVTAKLKKTWRSEMRAFMKENKAWLKERIYNEHRSRDGYISFMSCYFNEWYDKIFKEMDSRYIGCMIAYMMIIKAKSEGVDDLYFTISMYALENVCMESYVYFYNKDAEIRFNEARKEMERICG